jgi:S1/P1 Nuclease
MVIQSRDASPSSKALAYSWLFHLVGDLHQPLHAVSLYSVHQFPAGDRGGNSIPLRRGRNLHSLWDGLLGRRDLMRDVDREVAQLSDRQHYGNLWDTAANETDTSKWADESRDLSESFVYSELILDSVRQSPPGIELTPIELPEEYMKQSGDHARRRIIAAGIRLAIFLKAMQSAGQ